MLGAVYLGPSKLPPPDGSTLKEYFPVPPEAVKQVEEPWQTVLLPVILQDGAPANGPPTKSSKVDVMDWLALVSSIKVEGQKTEPEPKILRSIYPS